MSEGLSKIYHNYVWFLPIYVVFIILLIVFIKIARKKDDRKKIFLIGYLYNLSYGQILGISLIMLNFLVLAYTLVTKISLNTVLAIISSFMVLIAFAAAANIKYMLLGTLINGVNIGLIYLANLVNVLNNTTASFIYFILLVTINIFGLLFYIFTSFLFIKNICIFKKENYE